MANDREGLDLWDLALPAVGAVIGGAAGRRLGRKAVESGETGVKVSRWVRRRPSVTAAEEKLGRAKNARTAMTLGGAAAGGFIGSAVDNGIRRKKK